MPSVIIKGEELKIQESPSETIVTPPKYTSWKIEYDGNSGYAILDINNKIYKFKLNEDNNPFHNSTQDSFKTNQYLENNNNVDINNLAPSNSILLNNNGEIDNQLLEDSINKIKREIKTISNYKTDLENIKPTTQEELISKKINDLPLFKNNNSQQIQNNDSPSASASPSPSASDTASASASPNNEFISDVVETVLQNMNQNNMLNKESREQEDDDNDLFNNLLHKQQNNEFSSPIMLTQQENNRLPELPELLIKHAIDNKPNNNNEYLGTNSPQRELEYDIIISSPQTPLRQNNVGSYSPKDIIDELLYSDIFLHPHQPSQTQTPPTINQFQELPAFESPHDKIENLLEQLTSHKVESPVEQDAEKLFNINIFLEDLKTKKKTIKNKSNKSIQQNINAIEKILKTIKTNIKKKNNKITCKNSKIKSTKKTTTKTNKPKNTPKNKKITRKSDKIKTSNTNKKSKRAVVKKEENLFDSLMSNFT